MINTARIPQLTSVEKAVEIYYSKLDLSTDDIKALFGNIGRSKIQGLKKIADDERRRQNGQTWSATRVPTVYAFAAWRLDITDLEKRLKYLKKLKEG